MKSLVAFLGRFRNLEAPERTVKTAAIKAVRSVLGVGLTEKNVEIARAVIIFHVPSTLKSEIKLHEQDVLKVIQHELLPSKREFNSIH